MSNKVKVQVKIGGKEYTLVGAQSEEYIQKVAHYIDKKMNEISNRNAKLSTQMAAVLTAVNVADDYFVAEHRLAGLEEEMKKTQVELERIGKELRKAQEEVLTLTRRNSDLQFALIRKENDPSDNIYTMEKRARAGAK